MFTRRRILKSIFVGKYYSTNTYGTFKVDHPKFINFLNEDQSIKTNSLFFRIVVSQFINIRNID